MNYAIAKYSTGGHVMKVVVIRSPRVFAPMLRMIFKIKKEHRE